MKLPWLIFIEKSYAGLSVRQVALLEGERRQQVPPRGLDGGGGAGDPRVRGPEQVALGERLGRRLGERQPLLRVRRRRCDEGDGEDHRGWNHEGAVCLVHEALLVDFDCRPVAGGAVAGFAAEARERFFRAGGCFPAERRALGEALAIRRDQRLGGDRRRHLLEQPVLAAALRLLREAVADPAPFPVRRRQPGLAQHRQVARGERLRDAQRPDDLEDAEFPLAQQHQDPQAVLVPQRPQALHHGLHHGLALPVIA